MILDAIGGVRSIRMLVSDNHIDADNVLIESSQNPMRSEKEERDEENRNIEIPIATAISDSELRRKNSDHQSIDEGIIFVEAKVSNFYLTLVANDSNLFKRLI